MFTNIKIIITVVFGLVFAASIAANVYLFKHLNVNKTYYITTTSSSVANSYSSSGSFSMNIYGQYGNWVVITKKFNSKIEMREFMKSLTPIEFLNAKPDWSELIIQYAEITTIEKKTEPSPIIKTKTEVRKEVP